VLIRRSHQAGERNFVGRGASIRREPSGTTLPIRLLSTDSPALDAGLYIARPRYRQTGRGAVVACTPSHPKSYPSRIVATEDAPHAFKAQ
jgi:hypothetical protein